MDFNDKVRVFKSLLINPTEPDAIGRPGSCDQVNERDDIEVDVEPTTVSTPLEGSRPSEAFKLYSPQKADGMRLEPAQLFVSCDTDVVQKNSKSEYLYQSRYRVASPLVQSMHPLL